MKEDMPNWKRFFEEVTGMEYSGTNREPPQKKDKSKTATVRREGDGTEKTKVSAESI